MNKVNLAELKGIDKLIYLLEEHCRKHYGFKENDDIVIDNDSVQFHLYLDGKRLFGINVEKVIYKDFGFIKKLVDNDKIDLEKVKNIKLPIDTKLRARVDKDEKTCFNTLYTLKLLMLLSIEDNPIEFLVSILK